MQTKRERERERERQTDRQTDREKRDKERQPRIRKGSPPQIGIQSHIVPPFLISYTFGYNIYTRQGNFEKTFEGTGGDYL